MRDEIKSAIAAELRGKLEKLTKRRDEISAEIQKLDRAMRDIHAQVGDLEAASRAFGIQLIETASGNIAAAYAFPPKITVGPTPTTSAPQHDIAQGDFRLTTLRVMKEAFPEPMRVGDVARLVEARVGRAFHPKTTGMTLYRLSKKGLVRREGFNWFYIPVAHRKGGPASDPPTADEAVGGESTLFDEKGGER